MRSTALGHSTSFFVESTRVPWPQHTIAGSGPATQHGRRIVIRQADQQAPKPAGAKTSSRRHPKMPLVSIEQPRTISSRWLLFLHALNLRGDSGLPRF